MEQQIGVNYTLADSYLMYKKASKEKIVMGRLVYHRIVSLVLKTVIDKIFAGHRVQFGRLGLFYIRGKKTKPNIVDKGQGDIRIRGLSTDWYATNKLWNKAAEDMGVPIAEYLRRVPLRERKRVYHTNEHSFGYVYNVIWDKTTGDVRNKDIYLLRFAKGVRHGLTAVLRNEGEFMLND